MSFDGVSIVHGLSELLKVPANADGGSSWPPSVPSRTRNLTSGLTLTITLSAVPLTHCRPAYVSALVRTGGCTLLYQSNDVEELTSSTVIHVHTPTTVTGRYLRISVQRVKLFKWRKPVPAVLKDLFRCQLKLYSVEVRRAGATFD